MNRIRDILARAGIRSALAWATIALLVMVVSGCSIGPLNLGDSPAPAASQGTPGAQTGNNAPPPTNTPAERALNGKIVDAYSGQPVANAEITAGGILTQTGADGLFFFDAVPLDATVSVQAEGYALTEADPGSENNISIKLRPNTLSGRVTDAATGQALASVLVKLVLPTEPATPTATLTVSVEVTSTVEATATLTTTESLSFSKGWAAPAGYQAATRTRTRTAAAPTKRASTATSTATTAPTNTPLPPTATPTPKPIPPTGPGFVAVYTDDSGNYFFKDVPEGATLTFKMPGYKLTKTEIGEAARKDVALEVFKAEAIYITAPVASTSEMFDELIKFIEESRINAVVLNVQNDNSEWVYDTQNPDVLAAENYDKILPDMPDIVKMLKEKGIYTIARISTFQQPTMAKARPDLAVKSSASGGVWIGGELSQQAWLDASLPAAQDHLVAMTREVLTLGFDEIQFDYIRFPSDPAPKEKGKPVFSRPLTDTLKAQSIQQFMKKAHAVIEPSDAFMSIDIFGYTLWPDIGGEPLNGVIGQVWEYVSDYTDYICPMIYPSHFTVGEQGCKVPADCAYALVKKAGEFAAKRFEGKKAKYRPWLQAFDWYKSDYTSARSTKVIEQIRAAEETNSWGWQMWDPWNSYDPRSAFKKP